MFKLLENKIKYITMPVVGLLLALLFTMVYSSVSKAILADFTTKSLGFSKQIAKSFDLELNRIEQSTNFFINTEIKDKIIENELQFNQKLLDIKGLNSNIIGAFVVNDNKVIYATNSYYFDIAKYITENGENKNPMWNVINLSESEYVTYKKSMFTYITPIKIGKTHSNATLCVDVSYVPLFTSVDTDNLFFDGASIALSSGDNKIMLKGDKSIGNVEENAYIFTSDGQLCYKNQIENEKYNMEFKLPFNNVYHRLNVIKIIFLALWLVIMLLCYVVVSKFYQSLSRMLMNLNDKIKKAER